LANKEREKGASCSAAAPLVLVVLERACERGERGFIDCPGIEAWCLGGCDCRAWPGAYQCTGMTADGCCAGCVATLSCYHSITHYLKPITARRERAYFRSTSASN